MALVSRGLQGSGVVSYFLSGWTGAGGDEVVIWRGGVTELEGRR